MSRVTDADGEHRVNVLLAEDEESFVDALAIGLSREGFDVTVARDGNEALEMFDRIEPDLVLLDIMLPKLSGIDVCRAIRSRSSVPIIMVTAKGTEIDTVVGLEMGADDYVTKPYRLRELVARMHAVLRRAPRPGPGAPSGTAQRADDRGHATWATSGSTPTGTGSSSGARRSTSGARSSSSWPCSSRTPGRVLTRDTLIDRVWGTDYVGDTKTLDVHIKRLRTHVERDPSAPVHHHHRPRRRLPLRGPGRGPSAGVTGGPARLSAAMTVAPPR